MTRARIKIQKGKGRVNRVTAIANLFLRKGNTVTPQTMNKNYKTRPEFRQKVDEIIEIHNNNMMEVARETSGLIKKAYDKQVKENRKSCGRKKKKLD